MVGRSSAARRNTSASGDRGPSTSNSGRSRTRHRPGWSVGTGRDHLPRLDPRSARRCSAPGSDGQPQRPGEGPRPAPDPRRPRGDGPVGRRAPDRARFRHFAYFGFPVFEWSVRRHDAFAACVAAAGFQFHELEWPRAVLGSPAILLGRARWRGPHAGSRSCPSPWA